jgi:N-acetylglucosamine-6-sulfatase
MFMPASDRRRGKRRPEARQPRRLGFESLEMRALMTAAPSVSLARDTAAPGFHFLLQGSAEPYASVLVEQVGRGPVGATFADATGYWGLAVPDAELAKGEFRFRAAAEGGDRVRSAPADAVYRPNFVLVNADDMAAHDLKYMPLVHQLLVGSGTTFTNSFVPTSLSGPSRTALLTGQYAHNNGGFETFAPLGGAANYNASAALPNLLQAAGYRTAAFGKNETSPDNLESSRPGDPPPGWDEFSTGARNPGDPGGVGYYYFRDGVRTLVPDQPGGSTDVWADLAESFIERSGPGDSPFMLYFAPIITHRPYAPAPRHAGSLDGVAKWRPPSFNVVPPDILNVSPKDNLSSLDEARQRHLETLLSVDDAVGQLYQTLAATGELDNTIFVFTSDNGLMWGEHAMFSTKNNFFDESLRVPLVVRDGRLPAARVASQMALNIDIAPTFAHLGGVALPAPVDGKNLLPVVHGTNASLRSAFVMEHRWTAGYDTIEQGFGTAGVGIRTNTWKYVEYQSGKRDLFNLANDPFEMRNLGKHSGYADVRQQLASQMRALLPADKSGPVIASLSQYIEFDEKGLPYLRVAGEVSDAASGGSQVRTPEYFIDRVGRLGWGQPLDHTDGTFDAVTENFQGRIPLHALASLEPGPHTLYVRGRDVVGNWGPLRSRVIQLPDSLRLDSASDTGTNHTDGLTLDPTPTIHGVAEPGALVALFSVRHDGYVVALGKVRASLAGAWTKTLNLIAGSQHIVGVMIGPGSAQPLFTAALTIHVAAVIKENELLVAGSSGNDTIFVNASAAPGKVNILVNGVLAGTVAWTGQVRIEGLAGNDQITMRGSLPAALNGGEGDDLLIGGSGNDVLRGDAGNNQLQGGTGDDRYLFNQPAAQSDNVITEYRDGGYDTLDFSGRADSIVVAFGKSPLARGSYSRYNTTVVAAAGTPLSYEAIRSSRAGGAITVPASVRVITSGGDDRITVQDAVQRGATVLLKTLSVGQGDTEVSYLLTLSQGALRLSPLEAGGVPASQILGNGTNRIELRGTRAQINVTLRAAARLHIPTTATSSKLVVDSKLRSLTGSLLEHSTTTLSIVA